MKLLYEASNTIEAHMILNLLKQAGLSARIDGEYLQGGVGELPAIGLIRVMVDEADYTEARSIIQKWDSSQPTDTPNTTARKKGSFGPWAFGVLCGLTALTIYYHTPITEDGIDYDGDGALDEKWTYKNDRLSKTELDRNFDGKVDFIYLFDRHGFVKSSSSDEDFNGTFETDTHYDYGNAIWQKSDTTGDGFKDYQITFGNGTMETISFIDPATKNVVKLQEYGPFKLKTARVDTTGDGVLDTTYQYDSIEEITNKYNGSEPSR